MAKISSVFFHFFALKKRLFFDDFFRQKMTSFSLHFFSIFFKNINTVNLDISRILRICFFIFFYIFLPKKNRHIFLRFFSLKNVIFFTLKNAKKISKNISFWRFKFHYFISFLRSIRVINNKNFAC